MTRLLLLAILAFSASAHATEGRWASTDHVTSTSTKTTGTRFFLDVTIAADGSFKGTWEEYVCFNYSGPYGIVTVSCQRSKKPSPASGRLNRAAGTGSIDLDRLGKSPLRFKSGTDKKGQPQLDLELPPEWLKQGAPVLYETSLNRK
jgi:hypothetical protein